MEPFVEARSSNDPLSSLSDVPRASDPAPPSETSLPPLPLTRSDRSKRDPSPEVLGKRKRVRTAKGEALRKESEGRSEEDTTAALAAGRRRSGRVKPSPLAKNAAPARIHAEKAYETPSITVTPTPAPPQLLVAPPSTSEAGSEPATPLPPPPPSTNSVAEIPPEANQKVEWYFWNTEFQQLYLYPSPLFDPTLEILKFEPGQYIGPLRPSNRLYEDEFIRQQVCVAGCGFVARNLADPVASRMHFAKCGERREYFRAALDPLARLCWLQLFARPQLEAYIGELPSESTGRMDHSQSQSTDNELRIFDGTFQSSNNYSQIITPRHGFSDSPNPAGRPPHSAHSSTVSSGTPIAPFPPHFGAPSLESTYLTPSYSSAPERRPSIKSRTTRPSQVPSGSPPPLPPPTSNYRTSVIFNAKGIPQLPSALARPPSQRPSTPSLSRPNSPLPPPHTPYVGHSRSQPARSFDPVFLWRQTNDQKGRFVCAFCERAVTTSMQRHASLAGNEVVRKHLEECAEMKVARSGLEKLWAEGNDLGDGGGLVAGRKMATEGVERVGVVESEKVGKELAEERREEVKEEEVVEEHLWSEGEVPLKVVAAAKAFSPPRMAPLPKKISPPSKVITPPTVGSESGRASKAAAKKPAPAPKSKLAKVVEVEVGVEESSSDEDDDVKPNFDIFVWNDPTCLPLVTTLESADTFLDELRPQAINHASSGDSVFSSYAFVIPSVIIKKRGLLNVFFESLKTGVAVERNVLVQRGTKRMELVVKGERLFWKVQKKGEGEQ